MTTEELAKIIGISRVTLSKVLNGAEGVSQKTKDRCMKYIQMYNFEMSMRGNRKVGEEEKIIGLFSNYSEKNSGVGKNITSHFATELVNLVVNRAQKLGYKTLVYLTDGEDDLESVERILCGGLVAGAILLGYYTGSQKIKEMSEHGYPLVLLNQERDSFYPNVALVNMDDQVSAYYAIDKLVEYGHDDILYIGCERPRLPAIRRKEGVHSAVNKLGNKIKKLTEIDGDFNEDKAYNIVKQMYADKSAAHPTGIFAANDVMAIGAMNALLELGYDIPGDVSIIGFDDISVSKYLTPGLTTMRCDFSRIAEESVGTLVGLVEGKTPERHIEIPATFIQRGSLGNVKAD